MLDSKIMLPLQTGEACITIKQGGRYKRMALRIKGSDQSLQVTAPACVPKGDILDFLSQQKPWIEKKLCRLSPPRELTPGHIIPVLGHNKKIVYSYADKPKVEETVDTLHVKGFDEMIVPGMIKGHLHDVISRYVHETSAKFALHLGQKISKITVKDTTSRWGSCSSNRVLSYSWRLVFAPQEVARYLCAHEVCHLIEMNHSLKFWALVETLCPDYATHRKWLKENGHVLFSYT